jgi:hypothetical protein
MIASQAVRHPGSAVNLWNFIAVQPLINRRIAILSLHV